MSNLVQRNIDEIEPFRVLHRGNVKPEGGRPEYLYTEEGVYLISMLAQTPKAKEFRKKMAKMLRALRQKRFELLKIELLNSKPLWKKIYRYKNLGLNHREIALLVMRDIRVVRLNVRKMEGVGLLTPPRNLPAMQLFPERLEGFN